MINHVAKKQGKANHQSSFICDVVPLTAFFTNQQGKAKQSKAKQPDDT